MQSEGTDSLEQRSAELPGSPEQFWGEVHGPPTEEWAVCPRQVAGTQGLPFLPLGAEPTCPSASFPPRRGEGQAVSRGRVFLRAGFGEPRLRESPKSYVNDVPRELRCQSSSTDLTRIERVLSAYSQTPQIGRL